MKITATKLRADLYQILDQIIETGESVEVIRETGTIELRRRVSERKARSTRRRSKGNPKLVIGNPDDLVRFDWSKYWEPKI